MRTTAEVLRRQAGLMGATVRRIAREPAVGREVGRLVATGGRSTVRLRMPWLPFRLVDELADVVGPDTRVFEYGGGGSTLWFLDRGAEVVTVEHHAGWAATLRVTVGDDPRWTLLERSLDGDASAYVSAIESFPDDHFDLVVVDGRERVRCALTAGPKVRPGGLLVLDDIDRPRYAPALSGLGWPYRVVTGFAPAKPSLAHSAVLARPDPRA